MTWIGEPNRARRPAGVRVTAALLAVAGLLVTTVPVAGATPPATAPIVPAGQVGQVGQVGPLSLAAKPYVVVLGAGRRVATPADALAEARDPRPGRSMAAIVRSLGISPTVTYSKAIHGFAARLSPMQVALLRTDRRVRAVVPDAPFHGHEAGQGTVIRTTTLPEPVTPNGILRTHADQSPIVGVHGNDDRVDIDIAILDSGYPVHPDLIVAGTHDCTSPFPDAGRDRVGHATHVSGIVAARDDETGVVGMAPGARLWSVKVLNDLDDGTLSTVMCGLDWVMAQRDPADPSEPLIEVANMSLAGPLSEGDDRECGVPSGDVMHLAICASVADGTIYVVAAGNNSSNASLWRPAAYDEVITASGLADFDGLPGGFGRQRDICPWYSRDKDDTFYNASDFGPDIDLISPAKCILSTYLRGLFSWETGTSMATPHVVGAVAHYLTAYPDARPMQVRQALRDAASFDWRTNTDPDGVPDPLLDVLNLGPPPEFSLDAGAVDAHLGPRGILEVPVQLVRSNGHQAPVTWSVVDLPAHVSATIRADGTDGVIVEFRADAALSRDTMTPRIRATDGELTRGVTVTADLADDASVDIDSPAPGTVTVMGSDPDVTVAWTETSEPGAEPAARTLRRQAASPIEGGSCDGVDWANDGPAVPADVADPDGSPEDGWSVVVGDLGASGCYRWLVTLTDDGGSAARWASGAIIVDETAPSRPDVTATGARVWQSGPNATIFVRAGAGSLELSAAGRDADGGAVSGDFGPLFDGTGWDYAAGTVAGDPATTVLSWDTSAVDSGLEVTTTDAVGSTGPARTVELRVDDTPPTTPEWIHPRRGTTKLIDEPLPLNWRNGTDAGSGVAEQQSVQRLRALS